MPYKDQINIIIGNPPYVRGKNTKIYPKLTNKITETYVKDSKYINNNYLYTSYIQSYRWATDRLGSKGIVCFISSSGFLEATGGRGFCKHLAQDFTNLYFIDLRGYIRKDMLSNTKEEGGNVFGQRCMIGLCISILVKDPDATQSGIIFYYDIGKDLTAKQKKAKLNKLDFKNINWQEITPNDNYEWLNQRDSDPAIYKKFSNYLPIKEKSHKAIFSIAPRGIRTNRDAQVYNFSKAHFDSKKIVTSLYRPFTTRYLYYDKLFNKRTCQISKIFPTGAEDNKVIIINGDRVRSSFSVLISDKIVDANALAECICFPLYLYDTSNYSLPYDNKAQKSYAVKDEIVKQFQQNLQQNITHEDLFYYIYGILHSACYRKTFATILKRELPRIPFAKNDGEFQAFSQAGRELADLHLRFEDGELYSEAQILLDGKPISLNELKSQKVDILSQLVFTEKISFDENYITKEKDITIIHYNKRISICNIPIKAYEYKINNRSAIEYVMSQQRVKKVKMDDPIYPLKLLLRVINISLKSAELIERLPDIE